MARVLTWDEVRELRTGDKVYVEHTQDERYGHFTNGVHVVERDDENDDVALVDARRERWHVMPEWRHSYNRVYRAWDAEPTQEERGKAPEWGGGNRMNQDRMTPEALAEIMERAEKATPWDDTCPANTPAQGATDETMGGGKGCSEV